MHLATAFNLDDLKPYPIAVDLAFSSPSLVGGSMGGVTGALGPGYVLWDNPLLLNFGTNGVLSVSLTNAIFGLPGSVPIYAQFTLVSPGTGGGAVGVPEPASALLVGLGFAMLLLRNWRRSSGILTP